MNKAILICLVIAFMVSCFWQEIKLPAAKPEQVGLSSNGLNQIKPLISRYIDENKLPGVITMIARYGKVV